jgi:hypothetical protein
MGSFYLARPRLELAGHASGVAEREFGVASEVKNCLHFFTNERRSEALSRPLPSKTKTPHVAGFLF